MTGSPPGTNHGLRSERHDYSECEHKKGKAHYRFTELVATVPNGANCDVERRGQSLTTRPGPIFIRAIRFSVRLAIGSLSQLPRRLRT